MRQTLGWVTCLARCTSRLNRRWRARRRDVRQDGLERDPLVQLEILRLVELAHATLRQEPHDAESEGDDVTGPEHGGPGGRGSIAGARVASPSCATGIGGAGAASTWC